MMKNHQMMFLFRNGKTFLTQHMHKAISLIGLTNFRKLSKTNKILLIKTDGTGSRHASDENTIDCQNASNIQGEWMILSDLHNPFLYSSCEGCNEGFQ